MSEAAVASQPQINHDRPSLAANIVSCILVVYMMGCGISFPYYSWRFAQEHGFVAWLLLGEFEPLGESFIWPYYVGKSMAQKSWNEQDKDNLSHLRRATVATSKAMVLLEGFSTTSPTDPTDLARVQQLLNEALQESSLVQDSVLAKIHPDYPTMFRSRYVESMKLLSRAAGGDADAIQEVGTAERLGNEWNDWLIAHRKDLRVPDDIPK